jgi:hypothetical protein
VHVELDVGPHPGAGSPDLALHAIDGRDRRRDGTVGDDPGPGQPVHPDEMVRLAQASRRQHVDDVVEVAAVRGVARGEGQVVFLVERDEQVHAGTADVRPAVRCPADGDRRRTHP